MNAEQKLTLKDFSSDQEVRWCPGCGDYAILKTIQKLMPTWVCPRRKRIYFWYRLFSRFLLYGNVWFPYYTGVRQQ